MKMTKDEAQEVVDALDEAKLYVPAELAPLIGKAIAEFVDHYDVISDDTELEYVPANT